MKKNKKTKWYQLRKWKLKEMQIIAMSENSQRNE